MSDLIERLLKYGATNYEVRQEAADEIKRLTRQCTYKDEVIEQRNAMCLRAEARVEALEKVLNEIRNRRGKSLLAATEQEGE